MKTSGVSSRTAVTLIELLIVVAIVGLLLGLLLPAVQKARAAATRILSANNQKQIGLAIHHFETANGCLPQLDGSAPTPGPAMFVAILPYIDQEPLYRGKKLNLYGFNLVRTYINPADPTAVAAIQKRFLGGVSSYAANGSVFLGGIREIGHITDGTSATIFLAEHYSHDCGGMAWSYVYDMNWPGILVIHRPSFADPASGDVVPVVTGDPPVAAPSVPGLTFQVRPTVEQCNGSIPQTAFAGGMPCAFGDGSVRTVSGTVNPRVFWAMVTPRGGEVVDD